MLLLNHVLIELWPSLDEIENSNQADGYLGRQTEFYRSVDDLLRAADTHGLFAYTTQTVDKGGPVARFAAPTFAELAILLGPSLLAAYKLLKLWVDERNGRKIRVKDGPLEIEASQLTPEQFLRLLKLVKERERRPVNPDHAAEKDTAELRAQGFVVRHQETEERNREMGTLFQAIWTDSVRDED